MIFDAQPILAGETPAVKPRAADDRAALHAAAADPAIWAGHPAKDRHREEVFEPCFRFLLDSGTAVAIIDRRRDKVIGCSRYDVAPTVRTASRSASRSWRPPPGAVRPTSR